jgi:ferredoxin
LCIKICPKQALVADGNQLISVDKACIGCGLCQAACPQNAISMEEKAPQQGNVALLACKNAPGIADGLAIACIHSQGLEQIAGLYQTGIRKFAVVTGDCRQCAAGSQILTLDENLNLFNLLAESRNLSSIEIVEADGVRWSNWLKGQQNIEPVDKRRRAFLYSFVTSPNNDDPQTPKAELSALACFLAKSGPLSRDALFPHVATIDPTRCNGCDACINICPRQALTLVKDEQDRLHYTLKTHLCTGCRLCSDICEEGAVSLQSMTRKPASGLLLRNYSCKSCGSPFHLPDTGPDGGNEKSDLCQICCKTNHNRKLFQVLK